MVLFNERLVPHVSEATVLAMMAESSEFDSMAVRCVFSRLAFLFFFFRIPRVLRSSVLFAFPSPSISRLQPKPKIKTNTK